MSHKTLINNIQMSYSFQNRLELLKSGAKLVYRLKDPDSARYADITKTEVKLIHMDLEKSMINKKPTITSV